MSKNTINKPDNKLFDLVFEGKLEELKESIGGVDIDALVFGQNLLYYAVDSNKKEIVTFLCENGADVNILNKSENGTRETPLHYATRRGGKEMVEILCRNRADPNITNSAGTAPIFEAVGGYMKFANNKNNARHGSASGLADFKEILQSLIKAGANTEIKNRDNKTPAALLIESNSSEMLVDLAPSAFGEKLVHEVVTSNMQEDTKIRILKTLAVAGAKAVINLEDIGTNQEDSGVFINNISAKDDYFRDFSQEIRIEREKSADDEQNEERKKPDFGNIKKYIDAIAVSREPNELNEKLVPKTEVKQPSLVDRGNKNKGCSIS